MWHTLQWKYRSQRWFWQQFREIWMIRRIPRRRRKSVRWLILEKADGLCSQSAEDAHIFPVSIQLVLECVDWQVNNARVSLALECVRYGRSVTAMLFFLRQHAEYTRPIFDHARSGRVCHCLYAWMYVCQTITFESLDVWSLYSHMRYISREYGSSSYMNVIGSRSRSQQQHRLKMPIPTM